MDRVNPLEAKQLRKAFAATTEVGDMRNIEQFDFAVLVGGGDGGDVYLMLSKDGAEAGYLRLTSSMLKQWRSDYKYHMRVSRTLSAGLRGSTGGTKGRYLSPDGA